MYDLLIQNALVVDGSGAPAFPASVAAAEGKLHLLPAGAAAPAREIVDARGHCLAPGFIDCHSHGDIPLGLEFATYPKVSQGITTEVAGQCGSSMFPTNPQYLLEQQAELQSMRADFPAEMAGFSGFFEYLSYVNTLKLTTNVRFLMGHSSLRSTVMGYADRKPTDEELGRMRELLREAMAQGCLGMSAGLIYIPGTYAALDELTALASVVAEKDGVCAFHMRSEGKLLLEAVREVIEIGRRTGCHVHISHLKAMGKSNWGKPAEALRLIDEANAAGIYVTADQYPYTASMTKLCAVIPPKYFTEGTAAMAAQLRDPAAAKRIREEVLHGAEGFESQWENRGGAEGIFVASSQNSPEYEGKTLAESAQEFSKDPVDLLFELLIRNEGDVSGIFFCMDEHDVETVIQNPRVCVGTDGTPLPSGGPAHPRAYGTFPRAIRLFVRERQLLPLEAMVRKMTGLTADAMCLPGKGYIREGYDADLVLFDKDTIRDEATYQNSNRPAEGIDRVIIGGKTVLLQKQLTFETPGKVLLYRP